MARSKASARPSTSSSAPSFRGTFYPADVDGSPAAFVIDLEQEPKPTHPTRITVSVAMLEPESDGLRSESEMLDLDGIQEKMMDRLARAAGAVCVGFYDMRGVSTFVFYAKKKISAEAATVAVADVHPYEAEVQVDDDPEWRFYIDALFPDAYALQGIWNRLIVDELESHGDQLHEPRDVDHVATFAAHKVAQQATKKLGAAHFHVDSLGPADEEGRFAVAFHRSETLEEGKPDQFSAEVLDIVLPLDGEYDGWGAPAIVPEKKAKGAKKAKPATATATAKATAKAKPATAKATAKAKPAKAKAKAKPAKAKAKPATAKATAKPAKAKAKAKPAKAKAKPAKAKATAKPAKAKKTSAKKK
jgi:hypothetical protein